MRTCNRIDKDHPRIIRIQNSLHVGQVMLSEAYYADVLAGRYTQADERENLREELCLLRGLDGLEADYDGMHDSLPFRVRGRLPADRESMCRKLEEKIAEMEAAGEAPTPVYRGI